MIDEKTMALLMKPQNRDIFVAYFENAIMGAKLQLEYGERMRYYGQELKKLEEELKRREEG